MPLKPGKKNLEANFHELRHGSQFARTEKDHGTSTARAQMIAIALKEARKRAKGGKVHVGPIRTKHPGRTDTEPMKVADGSYVLPSETISHLGQNNSEAGLRVADHLFGPNGTLAGGAPGRARGGKADEGKPIDCITAGGEYVVPPETVRSIGRGDIDIGHKILDQFVLNQRKEHISALASLAPPARD
jgi:hypothetical protein